MSTTRAASANDGVDDLIKGNYLLQPSPYSWAQEQNKQGPLFAQMQNELIKQQVGKDADADRQRERLTADATLQTALQKMRGDQAKELAAQKSEDKDAIFEVGDDGSMTVPENIYRTYPPSTQRNLNHVRTVVKNGRNYMVLMPKNKSQGSRTDQYDQYTGNK